MEKETKKQITEKFRLHPNDVGSVEVQVALLTERIKSLEEHFKTHRKDFHGKRGFIILINKRRKLLEYLRGNKPQSYKKIVDELRL